MTTAHENETAESNRQSWPVRRDDAPHPATLQTGSREGVDAGAILALQRRAGNRGVVALIDGHLCTGSVQRQGKAAPMPTYGTGVTGQPVYGLGPGRTAYIQEAIDAGDYKFAIEAMTEFLEDDDELDRSLLLNKTMHYDAGLSDDGAVSPPGFDYSSYPPKALPCKARIGSGAFSGGVAYLHSVMMHEYQHVRGYQTDQSGTHRDAEEVKAYAWEILNAKLTKLSKQPSKVAAQWGHLKEAFDQLNKQEAVNLAPLARRALGSAQSIVGNKARLEPLGPI